MFVTFVALALAQCAHMWECFQAGTQGERCSFTLVSELTQNPLASLPEHHMGRLESSTSPLPVHDERLDLLIKNRYSGDSTPGSTPTNALQPSGTTSGNAYPLNGTLSKPHQGAALLDAYMEAKQKGEDNTRALQSLVQSFGISGKAFLEFMGLGRVS